MNRDFEERGCGTLGEINDAATATLLTGLPDFDLAVGLSISSIDAV